MVMISSTKYACETCIKGHRSSTCKHTDRPLFEIKKKGRPVTQCEHCRELRKTKQVHVKCVCEVHDDAHPKASSCSKKKASSKVLEHAAFPHGLPQNLEASIAMRSPAEGSPNGVDHSPVCACKTGGTCNCFTARKSALRRRRKTISDLRPEFDISSDLPSRPWNTNLPMASMSSSSLTHVLARIAELRPVLPKPSGSGPCHDPSSGVAHTHHDRHHTHENMFFSPYGRAYEYTHGSHESGNHSHQSVDTQLNTLLKEEGYTDPNNLLPFWNPSTGIATFPSACGCGDGCSCPGCSQHADAAAGVYLSGNAFNTCTNPGSCNACLDSTIMSLPNTFLPDAVVSNYGSSPSQLVDDWLRGVSDLSTSIASTSDYESPVSLEPGYVQPAWETYQLPDNPEIQQVPDVLPVDGVVPCICLPEECMCDTSKGEDCLQLVAPAGMAFAVLGKRMACQASSPLDVPISSTMLDGKENLLAPPVLSIPSDYLIAPQLQRSRSSSSSSYSGHNLDQFFSRRSSYDASGVQVSPLDFFSNDLSISSQPDLSPSQSDYDVYANSDPDSDGSLEDYYTRYEPTSTECTS